MLQKTNFQVAYCHERAAGSRRVENSSLSIECICGAKMRLCVVQPHLLAEHKVDVCVFECDECHDELRMIRPRDIEIAR
jgi:hypothetical protein